MEEFDIMNQEIENSSYFEDNLDVSSSFNCLLFNKT